MYRGNSLNISTRSNARGIPCFEGLATLGASVALAAQLRKLPIPSDPYRYREKKNQFHIQTAQPGGNPHLHSEVSEHCQPKWLIIINLVLSANCPLTSMVRHSRTFLKAGRSKSVTTRLPLGDLKCKPCNLTLGNMIKNRRNRV